MNDNNDKEISGLDEFFDDDPTDELPVLNLRDVDPELAEQFDDEPPDDTGEHERPDFTASSAPLLQPEPGLNPDQAVLRVVRDEMSAASPARSWCS